jgi:hypothetical protein
VRILGPLVVVLSAVASWSHGDYFFSDLVDAAKRGDGHAVHKLLELDATTVAETDDDGYGALHWAAIRGHWRIFGELLAAGAAVNLVGADGGTPLHWACHHDRPDMVALLLDAGADVSIHNRWGRTALHVAARRGCPQVARLLLDRGADIDAVTNEGWTPLHVAYLSGHRELVEILEGQGADRQRRDEEGLRPVDRARQRPLPQPIDPGTLADYVGIYDLGHGATVKIWLEAQQLRIREFAPDTLDPIAEDRFFCRQEPWRVSFSRGDDGHVNAVDIDFVRRTVHGDRISRALYVGASACRRCHLGEEHGTQYLDWLRSRHAHAYWRLGADWALFLAKLRPHYQDLEEPISDQRCLLCHTTGAQDPNALFAASYRPQEGVTCEACHGPASDHVAAASAAAAGGAGGPGGSPPDETTCRHCHRNAERFDFGTWWPKIAHRLPAPEEAEHE